MQLSESHTCRNDIFDLNQTFTLNSQHSALNSKPEQPRAQLKQHLHCSWTAHANEIGQTVEVFN